MMRTANASRRNPRLPWDKFPAGYATKSPCIDTGDLASTLDPDGTTADMGALLFDQGGGVFADGFESGDTSVWSVTVP